MNSQTLLHRQVNPTFQRRDKISSQVFMPTSQVFCPTPKDGNMLSVSDGDQITAEQAYQRFIDLGLGKTIGVLSVSVEECSLHEVPAVSDPIEEQPDHCFIDFRMKSGNQATKTATKLRNHALARGWSHGPVY